MIYHILLKIIEKIWAMVFLLHKSYLDMNLEKYQCMHSKIPKIKIEEIIIGINYHYSSKNIPSGMSKSIKNNISQSWHKKIIKLNNYINLYADSTQYAPKEIYQKMHHYSIYHPHKHTTPISQPPTSSKKMDSKN